jgi:hypothetical protein
MYEATVKFSYSTTFYQVDLYSHYLLFFDTSFPVVWINTIRMRYYFNTKNLRIKKYGNMVVKASYCNIVQIVNCARFCIEIIYQTSWNLL